MSVVNGYKFSSRVRDIYKDAEEFETLLEDARMSASTDFEEEFVAQANDNYKQFKGGMFWGDKQDQLLRRIAGPDDF